MSVVSIVNIPGRSLDSGKRTETKATRHWKIRVSSKLDSEIYVRNWCQSNGYIPTQYVDNHPDDSSLTCTNVSVTQDRSHPLLWDAVATYSSQPTSELDLQMQEAPNPLSRTAQISWSTVQYQEQAIRDLDNNAFCNSAGDPFLDPPVEFQRSRWVISITKNVAVVPSWLPDYENAVNNDTFAIEGVQFAAYTLRLSGISISDTKREKIAAGVEYFYRVVSFRLEHNRDKWHPLKVLDQGFRYIDQTDNTKRVPFREDNTNAASPPVTTPVLMDGQGTRLVPATAANAKFREFKVYPLKPFNGFVPVT